MNIYKGDRILLTTITKHVFQPSNTNQESIDEM